ncbi:MAG TPA: hypothetical protein VMD31_07550 [Opitutaceae bacterium]|nr:hypothetical protein [Opitutaceae bacterium]
MTSRLLWLCLALTAASAGLLAQDDQPAPPASPAADDHGSAGLLGHDYFAINPQLQDFRNSSSKKGWGTGLDLNLPAADNWDIGLNYAFDRVPDTPRITDNALGTAVTGYFKAGAFKPFADVDLGYLWHRTKPSDPTQRYDRATYAAGAGFEAAIADATAFVGRVAYNNQFRRGVRREMTYTTGFDQRFTDNVAGLLGVTFQKGALVTNAITYDLGVAFVF